MTVQSFAQVMELAKEKEKMPVSIVAPHDEEVLRAVQIAHKEGMIRPYLVGNQSEIETLMQQMEMDVKTLDIIHAQTDEEASYLAAELAHQGVVKCVMKGLVNSSVFLKGILNKDFDLRQSQLLSHVSIFEIPGFSRLIYITDGGLNVHPDMEQKDAILKNAIDFLHRLGVEEPKVAILAANERVMPGMPATMDAKELADKAEAGCYGPALVDGPVPLDLAISPEAAAHKRLTLATRGEADLLLAPTIEVGNTLGKAITYFGHGVMAGIVLGAAVPLVLTSRADSFRAKLVSLAFATLEASRNQIPLRHPN